MQTSPKSSLTPSGLLGPVRLIPMKRVGLRDDS